MCILFVHLDPEPEEGSYRLVIATNRDEYYHRPALDADWSDGNILGGRDMEPGREGGMWFGFSSKELENGKGKKYYVAVILNITGQKMDNGHGRGDIVKNYLKTTPDFRDYIKTLETSNFSGYNFIAIEMSKDEACIYHYGNVPRVLSVYTGRQTLAFGNSPTYSPLNKVMKGRYIFEDIVNKGLRDEQMVEALLQLLKDETKHLPDEELQRRNPQAYNLLSSIFVKIKGAGYGTRAHSVVLIDKNWNMQFIEHALKQPIDIDNPCWNVNQVQSRL